MTNPFWFSTLVKTAGYSAVGMAQVGMTAGATGIWIYERKTGKDVPLLVEVGVVGLSGVAVPAGTAAIDEALTRAWQKHGYNTTVRIVKKAAASGLSARAMARGTVRVLTRVGVRVVPVVGWTMLAYDVYRLMKSDSFRQFARDVLLDVERIEISGPMMPSDSPYFDPRSYPVPSWRNLPGPRYY